MQRPLPRKKSLPQDTIDAYHPKAFKEGIGAMDKAIQSEKVAQAISILQAQDVDCWLTFVRETSEQPDPVLKLTVGHEVTWQSAFLVTKEGHRIAIVGRYDA